MERLQNRGEKIAASQVVIRDTGISVMLRKGWYRDGGGREGGREIQRQRETETERERVGTVLHLLYDSKQRRL